MVIKALTLGDVDSGNLVIDFEQAINRMREAVIRHFQENDDSKLAKGSITVKMDISQHSDYTEYCVISYQIAEKMPARPKGGNTLVNKQAECLFQNQNSGIIKNPKQIDVNLGESNE